MSLQIWLPLNNNIQNKGLANINANVHNGTLDTFTPGKITNTSLQFSNSTLAIQNPLIGLDSWTIAFWVKPNSPAAWCDIFTASGEKQRLEFGASSTNANGESIITLWWFVNGVFTSNSSLAQIINNEWCHICITFNNGTSTCYINGIQTLQQTDRATWGTAEHTFYFGSRISNNYASINLNDVRIYDNTLSSEEVLELSQGLVAHYSFNWEEFYQPVEYIESTGEQYINTNISLYNVSNHKIILDMSPTQFYNYNTLWGSTFDADTFEGWIYNNGLLAMRYNNTRYGTDNEIVVNNRYVIEVEKSGNTLTKKVNGASLGSGTVNTRLVNEPFLLFLSGIDYGKYRLYSCKLYKNSILVRDFIPVIRKLDNKPGLFDLVENKFYINAGTGEFKYPNPIPTTEYEFLDYIESGKHQYIDTGWVPNFTNGWIVKADVIIPTINDRYCILSNYSDQTSSGDKEVSLEINGNGNADGIPRMWINYGIPDLYPPSDSSYQKMSINKHINIEYSYTAASGKFNANWTCDNKAGTVERNIAYSGQSQASTMLLFTDRRKTRFTTFIQPLKIYSCKIYDDNTLVRDYIPARRKSDGKTGMYDLVNNIFANSTGGFITSTNYIEPTGYKFIDYIEANEGQYINTEFKPDQDTKVQMSIIDSTSGAYYFGALTREGGTWWKNKAFCVGNDGGNVYTGYDGQGGGDGDIIPPGPHIIEQNKNITIVDGAERRTLAYENFKCDYPLYLFAQNRSGTATQYSQGGQTIKCNGCKIWKDNTLVRNFVPAIKLSDNRPGLYDLVSGSFYKNAGTGEFDSPALYHPVDYIASTGTQYINTNYYPILNKTKVAVDACKDVGCSIFGAGDPIFNFTGGGTSHYAYYNLSGLSHAIPAVAANRRSDIDRHLWIIDKNKVYIDNTLYGEGTLVPSTCDLSLYIFGRHIDGTLDIGKHKVYGAKIYEDDVLIHDFIPVVRIYDNKPGLYDRVKGKFYTNEGTGEFIWSSSLNNHSITDNCKLDVDTQKLTATSQGWDNWHSGLACMNKYSKCSAGFTAYDTAHHLMANLCTSNNFSAESNNLWKKGYGIYIAPDGYVYYADFGSCAIITDETSGNLVSYQDGDRLKIVLINNTVYYYKNDRIVRHVTNTHGDLYPVLICHANATNTYTDIALTTLPDPADVIKPIKDNSGYDNDISTFTPDLTTSNNTALGNQSLVFNGSDNFVKHEGELITGPFTISVWAKTNNTGNQCLFCDRGDTGKGPALFLLNDGTIGEYIRFDVENPFSYWRYYFDYSDNNWHLYTGVFDGAYKQLYIDGELKKSKEISGLGDLGGCVAFGGSYPDSTKTTPNGNWFNGEIADWRLYNTALSEEAIKDLYEVKAKIYNNNTFAANNIKAIDQEAIKTFVPDFVTQSSFNDLGNDWYEFNQLGTNSESGQYNGIIIAKENFVASHYYKLSFDVWQDFSIGDGIAKYVRGHSQGFMVKTGEVDSKGNPIFAQTYSHIFIDGQMAVNNTWHSAPAATTIPDGSVNLRLEKLYTRWKHYDVYLKYYGLADNNNLYIQPNRSMKDAPQTRTYYRNITITDYGTAEPTITEEVEIATKTSELKVDNAVLLQWIQAAGQDSLNKNSVYVGANKTLAAGDIKEI